MEIKNLLNKNLKSKNKIVKFNYRLYWQAIDAICNEINRKIDAKIYNKDIGLVGLARGALPMLVSISHKLNIRKVSILQVKMSNSDNPHDYGNAQILNGYIDKDLKDCILLEDIIYKGKTSSKAINYLEQQGVNVLGVYALIADKGYQKLEPKPIKKEINFAYSLNENDWVYFLWETNLKEISYYGKSI